MAIKRIKVSNFKSFADLDLELGTFNVLIGANASGKSNFTQIFRFVRDIATAGLDNAISLQGSEYLTNVATPFPKILSVMFAFDLGFVFRATRTVDVDVTEGTYEFKIEFKPNGTGYTIVKDELNLKVEYRKQGRKKQKEPDGLGEGVIVVTKTGEAFKTSIAKPPNLEISDHDIWPPFWMEMKLTPPPKALLIEIPYALFPPIQWTFLKTAIYDFDPKLSKKAALFTGKSDLEENGENLSLVLKDITEDVDKKRKFSNLVKDLLPFVEDMKTDRFADRSLLFKLSETFCGGEYFPAPCISDGTVNISALLVALYFEKKDLIIVEEPERNIHPRLISRLMGMMKDASKDKQIIVTTHSPEVVKHTDIENLLLVCRDKGGFSTVSRPGKKHEVKIFLENELGLDEIFVQNLWGA